MAGKQAEIDEDRARELLRSERERVEGALADLERVRAGELSEIQVSTDPAEDAELIEEGAIDEALEGRLRAQLEAIERAERRLEEASYGLSVESGEPIPRQRLEAIPWAERTAKEQEAYERTHGRPW
ncbi:MAG: TraR/DksA family transcriptional regulator [Solirubrobacterales bacterium]